MKVGEIMSDKISIAAIGEDDSIVIYNCIGFKTYFSKDYKEIDKIIFRLQKEDCKVIFVTDNVYRNINETIEKYKYMTYPIILPLPLDNVNSGAGLEKIKANVEKAIGINIF